MPGSDSIVRVIAADIYLDYLDSLMEEMVNDSDLHGALIVTGDNGFIVADYSHKYAGQLMGETSELNKILEEDLADKGEGIFTVNSNVGTFLCLGGRN